MLVEGLGFPERIGSQMLEPCGGGPRHTAAMVLQCFCGRSVSNPVTERSRLARLVKRRESGERSQGVGMVTDA